MRSHVVALLVLSSLLPACGGGGGSPAAPPPITQPPVARANITMTQTSQGQICLSPLVDKTVRIKLPMRIADTAGLGFNINAIRLSLYLGAIEVERSEMTASDIIGILGTNHVAGGSGVGITLRHDINSSGGTYDSIRYLGQFTDDRGNNIEVTALPPFNVIGLLFCTI
jgi:hypothetical protein